MVIRRLKIKNFGKIRDKDMELSPGINAYFTVKMRVENYHTYIYPLHVLRRSQTAGKGCSERYIYKI